MYLHALATATPAATFTQRECLALARSSPQLLGSLDRRSQLMLATILQGDSGVETRQFAVRDVGRLFSCDADALNEEFRHTAPALAATSLKSAMDAAGVLPSGLDALVVCTCTGYLCPGVSSYVAELLGLRTDAWLQDLVGLGCGAAIPSLRTVEAVLAANPRATVACVAVEICSAAFYLDNDPGVIISACLFGDGAAASIWRSTPGPNNLRCHNFDTLHDPLERDRIRFEQKDGKLRNLLHPSVPALAADAVRKLYDRTCSNGMVPPARVISHAGGKDVLAAIELVVPGCDLTPARIVLQRHGNMSSPSVLFALEEALHHDNPSAGGDWWLTSFGAGFSAHSCRLSAD
ncbi:MAG: stilbene synthase [Chthoniobacterales bacterium]|nr:stilbene synthase [Chthoniobacterales bacterium]